MHKALGLIPNMEEVIQLFSFFVVVVSFVLLLIQGVCMGGGGLSHP